MIVRRGNLVQGLTTAAGIWLVTAIGMACAAITEHTSIGYYAVCSSSTIAAPLGSRFTAEARPL